MSTDQDWIRTEANFGRIRTGFDCNFLKIGGSRLDRTKKTFVVSMGIFWKYQKFSLWSDFTGLLSGSVFCHQTQKLCWTILQFELYPPEMITIRFSGLISGRIMSLEPDKDIQKLLSNGNRVRDRIFETLLSIFRGFRLLAKVAHCTIIHLLSPEASFQPSAPWLRVCLWCNLWIVELCQVCQHESVLDVAR